MKKVLLIAAIWCCCAFAKACTSSTAVFQEFVSHQVEAGETVYSISKKYNVTEKQILKLNPDAKRSIYEGLVLILPADAKAKEEVVVAQNTLKFKKHKVKRKETLYSISKKYGVSQDAIKRFNKQLYSEPLRKGDKIQIPLNYEEPAVTDTSVGSGMSTEGPPRDQPNYGTHIVKSKETKYGVARMYGITIAELEAMNPAMGEGLQEGASIRVPRERVTETAIIDTDTFSFYEVVKGDTMFSLLRRLDMKADDLLALNPALADGLKEGMVLKIPKTSDLATEVIISNSGMATENQVVNLADSITVLSTKKLVLMLPFGLNRIDADTTLTEKDLLKKDLLLRISLDFHSGALMAIEAAKARGISVDLEVLDTQYDRSNGTATNARYVENALDNRKIKGADAVIGPIMSSNVNRVSSILRPSGIPVISPLTEKVTEASNVFQSRPSYQKQEALMLSYLKAKAKDKNVIIIADAKNQGIRSKLKALFPAAKEVVPRSGDKGYYLYPDDIPNQISATQENWVILETNDIPLISNVTTNLNTLTSDHLITLLTTDRGSAYDSDEIQHLHLSNLKFHFPSINNEAENEATQLFTEAYEDKYTISPSRFAIRGYDIVYDTLLRLAYKETLDQAAYTGIETEQVENKFSYKPASRGGFINEAVYLMRYGDNLQLEEIPLESFLDE